MSLLKYICWDFPFARLLLKLLNHLRNNTRTKYKYCLPCFRLVEHSTSHHIPSRKMPKRKYSTIAGNRSDETIPPKKTSWSKLVPDIRRMVLEYVLANTDRKGSTAHLATVCRDWQHFFEAKHFRRLVLEQESLPRFADVIKVNRARLAYIQHIWLRIDLPKYDCTSCGKAEKNQTTSMYVMPNV